MRRDSLEDLPSHHSTMQSDMRIIIVVAIILTLCISKPSLLDIDSYAVYYGAGKIENLSSFDLVIIESENYSKDEIEMLKRNGTIVLSYLSVGEVRGDRWYFNSVKVCTMGKNPTWNSYYVNVSCKAWRDVILNVLIPRILSKGFDGLFLDTVDVVDVFPNMRDDMINLISEIRSRYPNIVIIQNRGFSIIDETARYIDGVLFECFTTHYNWTSKRYEVWKDRDWIDMQAERLANLRERYGIVVLTLDYAEDNDLKNLCIEHARRYKFIPFVSNVKLNVI